MPRQLEQQRTVSGNSPETLTYPEGAAQTFEKGAPVILNASGQVIEATSPIASLAGVAAIPATGKTGTPIQVWIANDDTIFGIAMTGAVLADVGKTVDVKKTGAIWAADRTVTTGKFLVQEVDTQFPGAQPMARGHFLESATTLSKTA